MTFHGATFLMYEPTDGSRVTCESDIPTASPTYQSISYPRPSHRRGTSSENYRGWGGGVLLGQLICGGVIKVLEEKKASILLVVLYVCVIWLVADLRQTLATHV